jgi:drug/metabolite transporter (DMT)-like permease
VTPILGKQAILSGLSGLMVVSVRSVGASLLLFLAILIFRRRYLYIYPIGLSGCILAGTVNGVGSLFYYSGLERVDAGLGQLLYATYPIFVALLLYLDGQQHSRLTLFRLVLSVPAVVLLAQASVSEVDLLGIGFMLISGVLYGLHIPINERVLYEVPAPTVTLYTLLSMAAVVILASAILAPPITSIPNASVAPLIALTLVTFLSRLSLFSGVKSIGGMQTSLIGLGQLAITLLLAHLWLGEMLSITQWLGVGLLAVALSLVGREQIPTPRPRLSGWLYWLRPPMIAPEVDDPNRSE